MEQHEKKITDIEFIVPQKTSNKPTLFTFTKDGFFIFLYLLASLSGLCFILSLFIKGIFLFTIIALLVAVAYLLSNSDDKTGIENIKYFMYQWKLNRRDKTNYISNYIEHEHTYFTQLKERED